MSPVRPVGLPNRPGLSADRLAAEASYAAHLATWGDADKAAAELRRVATAEAETVTFAELRSRHDAIRDAELISAQKAVSLCREYAAHQEARLPEVNAAKVDADAALVKTEAAVVKKLASAGITVETQPAFRDNRPAAERTFTQQVRQSVDWQAAKRTADQAAEAVSATHGEIRGGKERLAQAAAHLQSVVERIAGVTATMGPRLAGLVA